MITSFNNSQKTPNNKEVIIGASNQNGQMLSVGSFPNTIQLCTMNEEKRKPDARIIVVIGMFVVSLILLLGSNLFLLSL